jgi:hypothetical protein
MLRKAIRREVLVWPGRHPQRTDRTHAPAELLARPRPPCNRSTRRGRTRAMRATATAGGAGRRSGPTAEVNTATLRRRAPRSAMRPHHSASPPGVRREHLHRVENRRPEHALPLRSARSAASPTGLMKGWVEREARGVFGRQGGQLAARLEKPSRAEAARRALERRASRARELPSVWVNGGGSYHRAARRRSGRGRVLKSSQFSVVSFQFARACVSDNRQLVAAALLVSFAVGS